MSVPTSGDRSSEYLTVAEVAEELRCSELTIRRRIRDGSLPAYRLGAPGSAIRIQREQLVTWLRESTGEQHEPQARAQNQARASHLAAHLLAVP